MGKQEREPQSIDSKVVTRILRRGRGSVVVPSDFLDLGSRWARYDLARPGTLRLLPRDDRVPDLRRDYQAMGAMYLSEPPGFDQVLTALADLEHRINQ